MDQIKHDQLKKTTTLTIYRVDKRVPNFYIFLEG